MSNWKQGVNKEWLHCYVSRYYVKGWKKGKTSNPSGCSLLILVSWSRSTLRCSSRIGRYLRTATVLNQRQHQINQSIDQPTSSPVANDPRKSPLEQRPRIPPPLSIRRRNNPIRIRRMGFIDRMSAGPELPVVSDEYFAHDRGVCDDEDVFPGLTDMVGQ